MMMFIFYCMIVSQYGNDWQDETTFLAFVKQWIFAIIAFMIILKAQNSIIQGFLQEIIEK